MPAKEMGVGAAEDVAGPAGCSSDVIDLRVPADPAYLAVIRTATAGVAMRLDLTLDEIEDLRIAVDEACALLMSDEHVEHVEPRPAERTGRGDAEDETGERADAGLHALFTVDTRSGGRLDVRIAGPRGRGPLDSGYPWMLLQALVDDVTTGYDASGRWIALSRSGAASGPQHHPV